MIARLVSGKFLACMIPRSQNLTPILLKLQPPRLKRTLTAPHAKPCEWVYYRVNRASCGNCWKSLFVSTAFKAHTPCMGCLLRPDRPFLDMFSACTRRRQCGLCLSRDSADGRSGTSLGRARHCVSVVAILWLAAPGCLFWEQRVLDARMEVAFHTSQARALELQAPQSQGRVGRL